jgi:hypothetical protein
MTHENALDEAIEKAEYTLDYILEECPKFKSGTVGGNRAKRLYAYIKEFVEAAKEVRQLSARIAELEGAHEEDILTAMQEGWSMNESGLPRPAATKDK